MPSDCNAITLSTPSHIGIYVKDLNNTIQFFRSMWGIGPWQIEEYEATRDQIIAGPTEPYRVRLAFGNLGETQLELAEPLEGNSPVSEFVKTTGGGIHHLCFLVSNWDEMVSRLRGQGSDMYRGGLTNKGTRWCYFKTNPGNIVVEISEK